MSFILNLSFNYLKEALDYYKTHKSFTEDHLESLHDFFGSTFISATEFLETCKITKYETLDGMRTVYKIGNRKEHYTIYENINFCHCPTFRYQVLENRNSLTCKHVLSVLLGNAMDSGKNLVSKETVTGSQMVDFLNEQLNYLD